ncbi:MAG: rRNA maturation RNase YbeY [Trueperaceae bacterium]|jgi:probable rRNA maturation factor|nr:rRNA maturation RNase YbeY [Truepera sp.]HRQ10015.1 rRNA maturation RNase YbeY [Trueperaceae bacterium]
MSPKVEVIDETRSYRLNRRLRDVVAAYMEATGLGGREVTIVLTSDAAIAERNSRDRGVAGPTDVLSYPTYEPDGAWFPGVPSLGDLFISLDTAKRQAKAHGHALADEVLVLAAHALTHLSGHDHQDEAAWEPFRAAQARILELARERPDA